MSVPKGTVFKRRTMELHADLKQIPRNGIELDRYIQVLPKLKNVELFSALVRLIAFQKAVREGVVRSKHRIAVADDWYEALKIEVNARY